MKTGKKSRPDYARARVAEILARHNPTVLTPGQEDDVERILEEARWYYKEKGLISEEETTRYTESMRSPGYPYGYFNVTVKTTRFFIHLPPYFIDPQVCHLLGVLSPTLHCAY